MRCQDEIGKEAPLVVIAMRIMSRQKASVMFLFRDPQMVSPRGSPEHRRCAPREIRYSSP